ncbi:MAG: LysM peptidoglycan-binding domain-containing protein [Acidobacteriota bacterium]|nr:LysM peptidoglycan-binding domain-containing protein [Acidobacteriota bacterium]MDH3523234.1 LysM peptidoglycan-binding domain-containing protein [Acidobacteriota bacterium]
MKRRGLLLAALAGAVLAASGVDAHEPPRTLHQVGDHWTAWDPPSSFEEGAELYAIVRGDTLWDLAARFYGDPYLWPQLWERNQYIRDAHWIYPGDPLVVGFEVRPLEALADLQDAEEEEEGDGLDRSLGAPQALGSESDLYCSGYIAAADRGFPYRILGSEFQYLGPTLNWSRVDRRRGDALTAPTAKVGLTMGDIIYLDGGEQGGLEPGSLYTATRAGKMVSHPVTGEVMGRFYRFLGRVRVLSVQETSAIGEVESSCGPMEIGDVLEPFEPQPIPLRRRSPLRGVNDPVSRAALASAPAIVYTEDEVVSLGQHSVVFIDRGPGDDMTPGDFYTIYRLGPEGLPPMVLGELAVLAVHERSAVARILEARYTVYVGDLLDPK